MYGNAQNATQPAPPQNASQTPQQYVVHHDFDGSAELTTTLVHAISDITGSDVSNTEFTLYDYVAPDALNRLFKPKPDGAFRSGSLNISIWNCQVTIFGDGRIVITPPTQRQTV